MKRFSQMTPEELKATIRQLAREEKQALRHQLESHAQMLRQKKLIARSYLIDPETIEVGKRYFVEGHPGIFIVSYLNGIMAWGHWEGSDQKQAYPIAALKKLNV